MYQGLNGCFYRSTYWADHFFTPGIYSDGKMYCVIALLIAIGGVVFSVKTISTVRPRTGIWTNTLGRTDFALLALCLAAGIYGWTLGNAYAKPAYDEVFSAQNIAALPPFQAVSYYMLPNNHIFFNLLNVTLLGGVADKVASGRIISLLSYLGLIAALYCWIKQLAGNSIMAFIVTLAMAVQFPTWGFSFQARGYALYLLAEWGTVVALFQYINSQQDKWLSLYIICSVCGYYCMPSFMYMHIAGAVFTLMCLRSVASPLRSFLKSQLAIIGITFLLYTPALSFSGVDAIIKNKYVGQMAHYKSYSDFMGWMFPFFGDYIEHIYSNIQFHVGRIPTGLILFILPVALLAAPRRSVSFRLGLFYTLLWTLFFAQSIFMKRLPFDRNLIGHYSFTLFCDVWLVYWLAGLAMKRAYIPAIAASVVALAIGVHFLKTNKKLLWDNLYGYEVNKEYDIVYDGMSSIQRGSVIAVSNEGFYCGYIGMQKGCTVHKCPDGTEAYYIKNQYEPMPAMVSAYLLQSKFSDYEIYVKK
jgi:hypothetical protein